MEILFRSIMTVLFGCLLIYLYGLYRNEKISKILGKWNEAVYNSRASMKDKNSEAIENKDEALAKEIKEDYDKYSYPDLYEYTFNMGQMEAVIKFWRVFKVKDYDKYNLVLKYLDNKD